MTAVGDYRKREESVTLTTESAGMGETHELLTLNIGPHHPATHGVLRLIATLEGEVVRDIKPIIGYVHTGIEKTAEDKSYWKVIPVVERMDYLSYYFNAMAFCGAVETLLDLEVPPRAQYLRVIHLELNRIMSHLVWLGTSALDLGAMSMFWYCFRERETILDLFEMSSGQRMHTRYIQVGGVFEDIPVGFAHKLRQFLDEMPTRADQYADLLEKNEILLARLRNTCPLDEQTLLSLGVTGPLLRAAGNPWDLRKAAPYSSYDHFDFKVPIGTVGDNYDRFRVRHAELYESTKIIQQALNGLPEGPHIADDRKVVLPPRHELATSMEALIHHFKLVTEGFRVPPGEAYYPIESPRGELGCFVALRRLLQARQGAHARPQLRQPAVDRADGQGRLHRRPDRDPGDDRPDPRRRGPMSFGPASDPFARRPPVRRYEHGSRVPGWDDEVDLTKPPATVPDPATTPVPEELRSGIEAAMALYPDSKSAAIPALHLAQRHHGWCSPEAITQVACVMRLTPAYVTSVASFYDMFSLVPKAPNDVFVCTNITCSLLGADEFYDAMQAAADGHDASTCRNSSASAPATSARWRRSTASTSARSTSTTRPRSSPTSRPAARCSSTSSCGSGHPPTQGRWHGTRRNQTPARRATVSRHLLFERHRRTRPEHDPGLRAPRRLQRAAQGARDAARGDHRGDLKLRHPRPRRRRLPDGPEGRLPAQGRHAQVPRLQRRRVGAGDLQGPGDHAEEPAHAARGHRHHDLWHRDPPRFHLHPRRVRAAG